MEYYELSIFVDVSIDMGGCFETSKLTTHSKPTFVTHGVIHYCVPNIASRVSHTATKALSYILAPIILQIGKYGGIESLIAEKCWFRKGVYMYKGNMTSQSLAHRFEMPYKDINLFMAARF